MKKFLELLAKLPNVHTVHDKVTAVYNAWLSIYALLHKLGLVTGGQLTPDQAVQVLNAEFAAGAARRSQPAPTPAAPAAPVDGPPSEPSDTDFMRASGLLDDSPPAVQAVPQL